MGAIVEQIDERAIEGLEEARRRLDAYLRAWKLSELEREKVATEVFARAEGRWKDGRAEPMRAVIEEAEKLLRDRLNDALVKPSALQTQRPAETGPMTMETSLLRLPSFRMIAGWFMIIVLLVLAFLLTR